MNNSGFAKIIDTVHSMDVKKLYIKDIVHKIITFDNRIKLNSDFSVLTQRQKAILSVIGDDQLLFKSNNSEKISIGIYEYGRIYIDFEKKYTSDKYLRIITEHYVSSDQVNEINEKILHYSKITKNNELFAINYFKNINDTDLEKILNIVINGIDHVDPVILYVKDKIYSNYSKYNNILPKNSNNISGFLFIDLKTIPVINWTLEEKLLIFSLYCVFEAGFRSEEFSGRLIEPHNVEKYFNAKINEYRFSLNPSDKLLYDIKINKDISSGNILNKVTTIKNLKEKISKTCYFYRNINGLNFSKDEKIVKKIELKNIQSRIPENLIKYAFNKYKISNKIDTGYLDFFKNISNSIVEIYKEDIKKIIVEFEYLIELVVKCSIDELHADLGMTRGLRNIRQWQKYINSKKYNEINSLSTSDYFCAVWPSNQFLRELYNNENGFELLIKIRQACSARMTFNSWHYMPSHFVSKLKSEPRHYYIAPKMFDTSSWSDQHHNGHIFASVRYCIRAPTFIDYDNVKYEGMNDLRLMRKSAGAFTEQELFRANEYTQFLRVIYQSISDLSKKHNLNISITSFSKDWYTTNHPIVSNDVNSTARIV